MSEHAHDHHGRHHDHEHEHTHEKSVQVGNAALELSSHMHEQAATVSANVHIAAGQALTFMRVVDAIGAIAEQTEAVGGIVGHIKGYAETAGNFVYASCTDAALGVNVEGDSGLVLDAEAKVQVVAIVMLVDLRDFERIVIGAF